MNEAFFNKFITLILNIKRKGFFHLLSANFLINLFGFGSQLFVAKFLSSTDLGRIKTMQSFISLAVIIGGFGLNTAVLKLCSENKSLDEKKLILKENLKFSFIGTFVVIIIMAWLALRGYLSPDVAINRWMLLFMFSIPSAIFTSLFICYIQALKKIQVMAYAQIAIRSFGVISLIIFTYFWQLPGFILSSVLFGLIALIPLFRLTEINWKGEQARSDIWKQSFYYGKWSVACNGLNAFGVSIGIFLLNYLVKDREILGDYGLAMIFILALNQVTGTVQAIATPFFSEKHNNKSEFVRVLKKYQKLLIILAGSIAFLAILIVPLLIKLAYPGKYQMAGVFFQILAIRYFFWSCYALLGVALIGLGQMKANFIASSINVLFAVFLTVSFIRLWGPIGVAYAQALSGLVATGVSIVIFKKAFRKCFA